MKTPKFFLGLAVVMLAACAPATPQVVKETVVVPKEVTRIVEKVVTATPPPPSPTPPPPKEISFKRDILPRFTQPNKWFEGSQPCVTCHFANTDKSAHELDLRSYEGLMKGADVASEPPGEKIVVPGKWKESDLRARLRGNRMPPGWVFMMDESNRDGPTVKHPVTGKEVPLIKLLEEWVNAGAPNN